MTEEHWHINKILEWGFDEKHNWIAVLYGCTKCDATSPEPFPDEPVVEIDHSNCDVSPCFGCKAKGLQLSAGDAKSAVIAAGTTQKKWDKELDLYRSARAQGIQPAGTSTKQIRDAIDKSDKAGKAFDANTGGFKE